MSSFKRKSTSKQASLIGTRVSPSSSSTIITSTGISSLDDILGGGLPLACSLLVLAPDTHTAYGGLVQKYFIAQGIACGQRVCIIDDEAKDLVKECMWMAGSVSTSAEDDEESSQYDEKIKIAWRYEQMKKFQTTVSSTTPLTSSSSEDFCQTLDLTCRIPGSVVENALLTTDLVCLGVNLQTAEQSSMTTILANVADVLKVAEGTNFSSKPLRICIPSLGSPQWGDLRNQEILYFLHSLRALLHQHPNACASLSLAPHLCHDGSAWTQKLGWVSDAAITLAAFTSNPSLSTSIPSHHGFLQIHTLPAPHTLLPASDKFSTLRGLLSSSAGGSGENNLAFKCMRKRLVFETLHLDLEGGVGERRTTPSTNAVALEVGVERRSGGTASQAGPAVEVVIEGSKGSVQGKKAKKKKVAFQSDRQDVYEF